MTISKEVLDELLSGVESADDLLGNRNVSTTLRQRLLDFRLGFLPFALVG
jgi:putative transposase